MIRWSGDLDVGTASRLRSELLAALDGSDVLVDLSQVTFFDCSTVGVLVAGAQQAQQQQRSLTLTRVPERVAALLRLTRVDTLFGSG